MSPLTMILGINVDILAEPPMWLDPVEEGGKYCAEGPSQWTCDSSGRYADNVNDAPIIPTICPFVLVRDYKCNETAYDPVEPDRQVPLFQLEVA